MGRTAAIVVVVVLAVTGCGGGSNSTNRSAEAGAPGAAREKTAPDAEAPKQRRSPRCGPTDLVVSHDGLGGGALSTYGTVFTVTNTSEHACTTFGFPRLVALGTDGRPIGGPARHGTSRKEAPPGAVTIRPNYDARFRATWTDGDLYASGRCKPRTVDRYRVTLPGTRLVQTVPFPYFGRCTNAATDRSFSVGRLETEPREDDLVGPPRLEEARPVEGLPRCADTDLLVWDGPHHAGGLAAGTAYGRLEVANLSNRACAISGVPRMVAVDLYGPPVGPPVRQSGSPPTLGGHRPIRIARIGAHRSAIFTYSVADALAYGTHGCEFDYAAGFDVTLPGATGAQYVPAPGRRCLRPTTRQMSVGPIE
ncbi:MAG TPA: DUF4232 domain-containing protein [Solirubrobacterales bacterium]|jgi:hypothetical protein|nr:DUF4232 domain-containing protein [Solirubrobacterales bacterium]